MGDHGVANTWLDVKPGREKQALELFGAATAQYDKAVAEHRIDRWDVVLFEPNGAPGAPNGAFRAYGSREQIEAFIDSPNYRDTLVRAELLLVGAGYRRFITGDAILKEMGAYMSALDSI